MLNLSNVIHYMRPGAARREAILLCLRGDPNLAITVNRKWCVQLSQDPDLRRLLKQGVLKRERVGRPSCRYTHLILNEK